MNRVKSVNGAETMMSDVKGNSALGGGIPKDDKTCITSDAVGDGVVKDDGKFRTSDAVGDGAVKDDGKFRTSDAVGDGAVKDDGKCSIVVIGAGPGGYETAVRAARAGLEVTLVTSGPVGGTCLNAGCIPTKCLCHSAEQAMSLSSFGVPLPEGFWESAMEHKRRTVEKLRAGVSTLLKELKVIFGTASFVDGNTVKFTVSSAAGSTGGEILITADRIIIATGSESASLPIPGADLPGVLDSTAILELAELPKRLTVIGGGVIGLEFASIFAALGSEVTVLEYCRNILPHFDVDLAKRLKQSLSKRGVNIVNQAQVTEIQPLNTGDVHIDKYNTHIDTGNIHIDSGGPHIDTGNTHIDSGGPHIDSDDTHFENGGKLARTDGMLSVKYLQKDKECVAVSDKVLMAVGRKPRLSQLNLDAAGIEFTKRGITVDSQMRTTNPAVYAIGDVNGIMMLAHVAVAQGKVALDSILEDLSVTAPTLQNPASDSTQMTAHKPLRKPVRTDIVPSAVFTVPEAATVGLTEEQCEEKGIEYKTVKSFYRSNGKALAMDEPDGWCKIIVASGNCDCPDIVPGQILGCHILGAHSSDLISEVTALMNFSATLEDLDSIIHAHPTLSEILVSGIV